MLLGTVWKHSRGKGEVVRSIDRIRLVMISEWLKLNDGYRRVDNIILVLQILEISEMKN